MKTVNRQKAAEYHRNRAGYWQTQYMLHATGGKPGRARNARRLYNFHMQALASQLLLQTGGPVQIDLIP